MTRSDLRDVLYVIGIAILTGWIVDVWVPR
jgi:hypothetical protein